MRLWEAILEANRRALSGDRQAGVRPADYANELPMVALTCIDPRLNRLLPEVLGIREEDFIWLRNAGNIVFEPMSSMMRTVALACAIKGGKEIAVIGHTDCRVRQVSVNQLIESFRALGINRASLPDNLVEFFGLFASERQNVINGVEHMRRSPLISPKIPVHGVLVDIQSGQLEWLVNGYEQLGSAPAPASPLLQKLERAEEAIGAIKGLVTGEVKFPEVKIGDLVIDPKQWSAEAQHIKDMLKEKLLPGSHEARLLQSSEKGIRAPRHSIPIPPPIEIVKRFIKPKK